jgi:hypothetical protein
MTPAIFILQTIPQRHIAHAGNRHDLGGESDRTRAVAVVAPDNLVRGALNGQENVGRGCE